MSDESTASNLSDYEESSAISMSPSDPFLEEIMPDLMTDIKSRIQGSLGVNPQYHPAARINQLGPHTMSQDDYVKLNKANILSEIICHGHAGRQITLRRIFALLINLNLQNTTNSSIATAITETIRSMSCQYRNGEAIHCTRLLTEVQNSLQYISVPDIDPKFNNAINHLIANKKFDYVIRLGDNQSYKASQPLPELWRALKFYNIL